MATDRKADHFTAADNYRDIDGNMKTFKTIDYDVKTSISFGGAGIASKEKVGPEKTELQVLCERIIVANLASDRHFIEDYDSILGKKYNFVRFYPGSDVTPGQMGNIYYEDDWRKDLESLYKKHTKKK